MRFARRAGAASILTLGVMVAVLAPAGAASAHNYPVDSSPTEGEVVTEQPELISLTTNDNLLDLGTGAIMQVTGSDGLGYGTGCATVFGPMIETEAALGDPGEYTVAWHVVSTDGHPISGEWSFTWAPAEGVELAEGSSEPFECGDASGKPVATDDATDASGDAGASDGDSSGVPEEVFWIGGAVLAMLAAGVVTWLVLRRSEPDQVSGESGGSGEPDVSGDRPLLPSDDPRE